MKQRTHPTSGTDSSSRWPAALVSLAALTVIVAAAGCDPVVPVDQTPPTPPAPPSAAATPPIVKPFDKRPFQASGKVVKLPDGLSYQDMTPGSGAPAKAGDRVGVWYTGTLENGTKFDSSRDRGQPFTFILGAGQVIKGWDEGVAGMKVGGRRMLIIPPSLGYGATGSGPIPANSTLKFDVEVAGIQPGGGSGGNP